eukprot:gene5431-5645_t
MSAHATGHASTRQSDGWANSKELPQRRGLSAFQTSQDEGGGGETSSLDLEPDGAYYPPALGGESDKWRPMLVTSCTEATPKHWAPCQPRVADSERAAIEYAEEVLYPDFEIPIPLFTNPEVDFARWHELHLNEPHFINPKVDFARWHELHLYEPHGMPSRSNWATSCMSMQTQGYLHPVDLSNATATYESAILLSSPDSWSWPHFMDRVLMMLVQFVRFICHIIHIYNSLSFLKEFGLNRTAVPISDRKLILLLDRGQDKRSLNKGRIILNHNDLLNNLTALAARRGHNEVVEVFVHEKHCPSGLKSCMDFCSTRVRAVVFAHDSHLHNSLRSPLQQPDPYHHFKSHLQD